MPSRHNERCLILLVSSLLVARQFSQTHFPSCVIDDSILHMSWVRQFTRALSEGVWLPRWLPESNGGYGSPVFIFYSPLVYYVSAALYWAAGSVVVSMKLVRGIGLFLSGLTMLSYARRFSTRWVALAIALVYIAIPFHVLDISYWTLFAETWAWIWFPLILTFLQRMKTDEGDSFLLILGLGACYAGLIVTHLVSAYMFSFVIAGYVLVGIWELRKSTRQPLEANDRIENSQGYPPGLQRGNCVLWTRRVSMGVLFGMGLAAFFLLPVLVERQFVHLEYSTLFSDFNFRNTFLFFPNPEQMAANSFQARTVALLQVVAGFQLAWILVSLGLIIRLKSLSVFVRREMMFSAGVVTFCLFLMSRPSAWLWDRVPGLAQIQFSTRWLSILTFSACLLIGVGFDTYRSSKFGLERVMKLTHFSLGLLAALMTMLIIFGACFLGEEEEKLAERNVVNAPEYNPRSMPNWKQRVIKPLEPRVVVLDGVSKVDVIEWRGQMRRLRVESETATHIRLRILDYPGWAVKVDGRETPHSVDPASGGVVVSLSAGFHQVSAEFTWTWWRGLGAGISLVFLGLAFVGVGLRLRRKGQR
jgi:hypothetical protein